MDKKEILKRLDHTLLGQTAAWEDIRRILDEGMEYKTASACIPASYVKQASEYVDGKLLICTVIGFPNGYSTTAAKVFEAKDVKVKAAGGIATLDDAEKFISLGAERLGTSRLIKMIQNTDDGLGY